MRAIPTPRARPHIAKGNLVPYLSMSEPIRMLETGPPIKRTDWTVEINVRLQPKSVSNELKKTVIVKNGPWQKVRRKQHTITIHSWPRFAVSGITLASVRAVVPSARVMLIRWRSLARIGSSVV